MRHATALLLVLAACGSAPIVTPDTPTPTPTATPPVGSAAVKSTLPSDGDTEIAITTLITIVFGASMDASTINDHTIHLSDGTPGMVSWRGGRTATLLPKGGLKKGTTYTVLISGDCTTEDGEKLGTEHSFSFTTVEPGPVVPSDPDPPTVNSTSPAAAAEDVAIDTKITATFSEDVKSASVTATSFFVGNLSGTIAVNGKTVTFTPSAALAYGTTYKASLTTAITDLAGNPLAGKHEWLFTTQAAPDTQAPALSAVTPQDGATNVALDAEITLTFSEAIKASTVTSSSVRLEANGSPVTCLRQTSGTTITLFPGKSLVAGTAYTIIVTAAVTDVAGNAVSGFSRTFSTLPPPDTTAPVVTSATPANNATGVELTAAPSFQFDEALDPATAIAANITFKDGANADVAFSVGYAGTTLTVTPAAPLSPTTTYNVTLATGLADVAGNSLAAAYTISFTTN